MSQAPPPYPSYRYNQPPPPGWTAPGHGYAPPPPPPAANYANDYSSGTNYTAPPPPVHGYGGMNEPDVEWAGQEAKDDTFGFNSRAIRQQFVRKVFMILSCQLAFVAALVGLFVFERNTQQFVRDNVWLVHISYLSFLVTYIVLVCCENVRRRFPGNFICLAVLTGSLGFMTATFASFYDIKVVFIALAVTVVTCSAVILFAMQTKYDFTGCIAIMFVVSIALFLFGIIIIVMAAAFPLGEIKIMWIVYCGLATLLFMVYLAIDVQMVIGGKHFELSPEDYILAATQLFIDIVYIFLYLLQIVGFASK